MLHDGLYPGQGNTTSNDNACYSMHTALLSTAYLAPVRYYTKLACYKKTVIEVWENYRKQSFRNRCMIASANGPLALSIPVERTENIKCLVKDIKIDYRENWQKQHFKAIESAYRNAPFFLYYIDDIAVFFFKRTSFLFDFNFALQEVLLKNTDLKPDVVFTDKFISTPGENTEDYRNSIHPKERMIKPDIHYKIEKYPQVFDGRYGFIHDLSIIDLLFNTGPDAKGIILKSYIS